MVVDRLQQRSTNEEALGEQLVLKHIRLRLRRRTGRFCRPEVQQLSGVIPFVEGLRGVDAFVALQSYEFGAGRGSYDLRELGLADARVPFEQERSLKLSGQEDRCRQSAVSEVFLAAKAIEDRIDAGKLRTTHRPAQ